MTVIKALSYNWWANVPVKYSDMRVFCPLIRLLHVLTQCHLRCLFLHTYIMIMVRFQKEKALNQKATTITEPASTGLGFEMHLVAT